MNKCEQYCRTIQRMCNNKPQIPVEYQQIEYLQSSGTQYIRTGLYGADSLEVTFQTVTFVNESGVVVARTGRDLNNRFGVVYYRVSNSNKFLVLTSGWNGIITDDNQKHDVAFGSNTGWDVIVDGTIISTAPTTAQLTTNQEMYLFRDNAAALNSRCKIYAAKFYKSGTLERDMYPCYRKSDNKPGMYDLVTNTFFTNAGTGEFTVGNNI